MCSLTESISTQLEGDRRQNLVDDLLTRQKQLQSSYKNEGTEPDVIRYDAAAFVSSVTCALGLSEVDVKYVHRINLPLPVSKCTLICLKIMCFVLMTTSLMFSRAGGAKGVESCLEMVAAHDPVTELAWWVPPPVGYGELLAGKLSGWDLNFWISKSLSLSGKAVWVIFIPRVCSFMAGKK